MKKTITLICVSALLLAMLVGCSGANGITENIEVTNEATNEVESEVVEEVKHENEVVVAGTVSVTRILYGLGVDLTAVPTTNKYLPEELLELPRIGMAMSPDLEIIKSLEPTWFITDSTLKERLGSEFEEHEVPVVYAKTSGYDDIINTIIELGEKFDKSEEAEKMVDEIKVYEDEAKEIISDNEPLKVAVIFGTPGSFMLATENSYVGGLIKKAGSINVTSEIKGSMAPFVPFSLEVLADLDPDVILRLTHVSPKESKAMFDKEFDENSFYQALSSVKNERVYDLDSSLFGVVATVDCGKAFVEIAKLIYGQ